MSEENAPITVTMKGGAGFEAPWLVIRGNRPDEVANMLSNLGNLPEVIAQQASLFAGTVSAGPVLQQAPPVQQEQPAPQAAWGTINPQQGGFVPAQQGQQWQGGQQAPPQQQGGRPQAQTHPEGLTCPLDNKLLEFGKTRTNKGQWKCPDYRWNNGNPNEHRLEWAN